ncbi:MAG: hypothetical protein KAT37_00250 [Candidatus Aenigmarchaeota archaeon]|nr:hypothetical protein [Candidatus Aenigmarchaeota archaeon]
MLANMLEFMSSGASLKLVYGLGFMFFTLLVASVSDLRKMTIKAEFMTMWICFSILMLWHDYTAGMEFLWFKWLLIIILGTLSWKGLGKIFSLARADVIAISAVCSVLELPYIIFFYIILVLVNKIGLYPLKLFGKKGKYPFMPVIWFSLLIIIIILGIVEWDVILGIITNFT